MSDEPMIEKIEAKSELSVGDVAWLISRVRTLEDAMETFLDMHGGESAEPLRVALQHRRYAPYREST